MPLARVLFAVLVVAVVVPSAASAQERRTYVSPTGSDSAPCSWVQPCATFATAQTATREGGEIHALDSGDYGYVNITKSLTIDGHGHSVKVGDPNVLTAINVFTADPTDKVILRDMRLNGMRNDSTYFMASGVRVTNPATVVLDDMRLNGFRDAAIHVVPSNGTARLVVRDTRIDDSGNGIHMVPLTEGAVRATVRRTDLDDNGNGIVADASITTMSIKANVISTNISGSGASGGNGTALWALVERAAIRIARNEIQGNRVGMKATHGGRILSAGDNLNFDNTTNGAPTGTFAGTM